MAQIDYDQCKQHLQKMLPFLVPGMKVDDFIRYQAVLGGFEEYIDRLVMEIAQETESSIDGADSGPSGQSSGLPPTAEAPVEREPFILFYLGDTVCAGGHLSPECHVIHEGWDGRIEIEAILSETLDQVGWRATPDLIQLASGSWLFHQTVPLTRNSNPCPPGTYAIRFTCHFRDSCRHEDSSWHGSFKFQVTGQGGGELVIASDGNSLTNLAAVDLSSMLQRFSKIRLESSGNALINWQSFESALKQEPAIVEGRGTASMTPVKLAKFLQPRRRGIIGPIARKCLEGRFDLPNGRRVLIYAKNQVILGRNRPKTEDAHTDIAVRLYPRNETRDALTRFISRQHLEISATQGQIHLHDPRGSSAQQAVPAQANRLPLPEKRSFPHSRHGISYSSTFGSSLTANDQPPQLGLLIRSFQESVPRAQLIRNTLQTTIGQNDFDESWLRDESGLDALLIERRSTCDELNGLEAYLLVMGIVLIGSNHDCPLRIEHPGIRPDHAILCHWDGQFRILPIDDAPVVCNGRRIHPDGIGTLPAGGTLKLGELELTFDAPLQFGLSAIS